MILTEVKVKWSVILMNLLGQDTFLRYEWEKKFGSWASTFEIKKDPCWSWKSSSSRLELSLSWMVVFHYLPLVFPPKTPTRKFGISASNLCSFYSSLFFQSVSNFSLRDISAIKTNFEFSGPYGEIRGKTRAVC